MNFPRFAATTVRIVDSVPALVWAGWILAVVVGAAFLALNAPTFT
jgi:hypothetical protein